MDQGRPCVEALKQGISDSFTMYFRAHAYHWNVKGPDFHEYHSFFAAIYEDIYGSIDIWAENIRKLGADAPQSLAEIGMPSRIDDVHVSGDPMEMTAALYDANEVVIQAINTAFQIATEINEQGIADFLAARDDMHKKWRWQMGAILNLSGAPAEPMPQNAPAPFEEEKEVEEELVDDQHTYPRHHNSNLIYFGDATEQALADRTERHNKKAPAALKASIEIVKTVYRRGALIASAGERDSHGIARVDAFLRLLRTGRPANPSYVFDNDLLPESHALSTTKDNALVASVVYSEVSLPDIEALDASKPEAAVTALAEFSGLGYSAEPAFRAAWIRSVNDGTDPLERVKTLARDTYDSPDSDLLPTR